MKDEIRVKQITIEYDKSMNLEHILKLRDFLNENHHLDFPLEIVISNKSLEDYDNFHGIVSLLSALEFEHSFVLKSTLDGLDENSANLLFNMFAHVVFIAGDDIEEKINDDNIVYLASRNNNFSIELQIDEDTTPEQVKRSLKIAQALRVHIITKVNYINKVENEKTFIESFNKINSIIPNVLYVKSNPMLNMFILEDGILRTSNNTHGIVIDDNSIEIVDKHLNENRINERCINCRCLSFCKGGPNEVFDYTKNADVFCTFQNITFTNKEALG